MTGILLALDVGTIGEAERLAGDLVPHVDGFKVGLELLLGGEHSVVERIANFGLPVFADAKLHDIPATVERAARQLGRRGARWVTVHAQGGLAMMSAGVSGLHDGSNGQGGVLGVTVLTSLDPSDLVSMGVDGGLDTYTMRMLDIATQGGAEGVICAISEARMVKERSSLTTVTPGVRAPGMERHDQKRVGSVEDAVVAGVDYVVVGRAITASADPPNAAANFKEALAVGS